MTRIVALRIAFLALAGLGLLGCCSLLHLFIKYRLLNGRFRAFGIFFAILAINFGFVFVITFARLLGSTPWLAVWPTILFYGLLVIATWYLAWQLWKVP